MTAEPLVDPPPYPEVSGLCYRVLIVATGMWKPYIPNLIGVQHAVGYENVSTDPADFEGKAVLILGELLCHLVLSTGKKNALIRDVD